ncbi:hypothetical protein BOTBODRAFT_180713 [Botryobasidium botryosum FD-172 SS1]|uniref:GPI transamidase component PIG-S n=1 Tax=Botryobasidium botryosum (strain FD-172 SS1) TaxID=930990 RepID=A0A067LYJ7_BOTB1|nr:hypothetical protein BOTBODRAFT_180713 [Botryobasidium botryosum FD-172 SS1]
MSTQEQEPTSHLQSDRTRRLTVASHWIVILLAIPLWWSVTNIERLSLPRSRVARIANKQLRSTINILVDEGDLRRDLEAEFEVRAQNFPQLGNHLDLRFISEQINPASSEVTYRVNLAKDPQESQVTLGDRSISFPAGNKPQEALVPQIAETLQALLLPPSTSAQELRVIQYAPRYRLAFTLLNEDASVGGAIMGWEIASAINRYLSSSLERLHVLHNFTIESQVQFHAPLAFDPDTADNGKEYVLDQERLKTFVNSAEWTLASSVSNDPVLHFVLFIPSAARRPLRIVQENGAPSKSNAFIVPQWGGIIIHNPPDHDHLNQYLTAPDLSAIFTTFRTQLLALLGVPQFPANVVDTGEGISSWNLDAMLRRRAAENTKGSLEALGSIVKLVDRIKGMPIKNDVKGDFIEALEELDQVYSSAVESPEAALLHSSRAHTLSSRAFFNPGMLAMLYFPAEHTYAVYTPLFAPAAVPLFVAIVREFKDWKKRRQDKTKKE